MNPSNPVTDLVLLHRRILAEIGLRFPDFTLGWYVRQPDLIQVPAIGLELTAADPTPNDGGNIGTEHLQMNLRFEAYIFTDYKTEDYRIKTRLYGLQLAAFIHNHQWSNVAGGLCRVIASAEDRWRDSGAAQYDCWRVEWEQTCLVSDQVEAIGTIPSEIYLGFSPETGPDNIDKYKRLV